MVRVSDFRSRKPIDWCPGCGNFGILSGLKRVLASMGVGPDGVVIVSGIGCSAKLPHFINANGFHSIHGRALPVATGIKLATDGLRVIAVTGDGDGLSIGGAHFINTVKRNVDITHVFHNNAVYGLTTGQVAPTSQKGLRTKTTPEGNPEEQLRPVPIALVCGATFVARAYVNELEQMVEIFQTAIEHRGYALVDVLQPCVTFNKVNTYDFYNERVYKLEDEGHDTSDINAAIAKGYEWGERIPLGVFYRTERPTMEDGMPGLSKGPLCRRDVSDVDITSLYPEIGLERVKR